MPAKYNATTSMLDSKTVRSDVQQGMLSAALTQRRGATATRMNDNGNQNIDSACTQALPPINTRAAQNHVRQDQEASKPSNLQHQRTRTPAREAARPNTENTLQLPKLDFVNIHNSQRRSESSDNQGKTSSTDYVLVGPPTPRYKDQNDLCLDSIIPASAVREAAKREYDSKNEVQKELGKSPSEIDSSSGDGIISGSGITEDFDDCDVKPVTEPREANFARGVTQGRADITDRGTKPFGL